MERISQSAKEDSYVILMAKLYPFQYLVSMTSCNFLFDALRKIFQFIKNGVIHVFKH